LAIRSTIAIAVTASLLCALHGDVLERRLTGRTRTSSAAKVLLLVLLTLVVFWDVERPANVAGEGFRHADRDRHDSDGVQPRRR